MSAPPKWTRESVLAALRSNIADGVLPSVRAWERIEGAPSSPTVLKALELHGWEDVALLLGVSSASRRTGELRAREARAAQEARGKRPRPPKRGPAEIIAILRENAVGADCGTGPALPSSREWRRLKGVPGEASIRRVLGGSWDQVAEKAGLVSPTQRRREEQEAREEEERNAPPGEPVKRKLPSWVRHKREQRRTERLQEFEEAVASGMVVRRLEPADLAKLEAERARRAKACEARLGESIFR